MSRYGCVATGVAFVARRVGGVRRTPAVCRRRLTPLRLKAVGSGEGGGGGAVALGGDQLDDLAFGEAVA